MELDTRLTILKDSGQIDEEVYKKMLKVICMFYKKWNIELKEDNGSMLITHLCIALQRVKNNCPAEKIEDDVYKEVKLNPYFKISTRALSDIQKEVDMDIPESEKSFLMMHLCVLFQKENITKCKEG